MSRVKKFAGKLTVYTIGTLGTKILTFLIVPYYTYMLSTKDFGYYDLLNTSTGLLTPLITLQTNEVIIAGCIDENRDNQKIVKTTFTIALINAMIFLIGFSIINLITPIRLGYLFATSLIFTSLMGIVQQYTRGYANSKLYAISGVVYTILFLGLNVLNLSILKTGVRGLFISSIISSIITILLIFLRMPIISKAIFTKLDKGYVKWIIKYSLPLIPNTMCWWVINASDRYVIKLFLGDSANGVYAVSYRFAAILSTMTNLVYLAWQEFSLEEYKSSDKGRLYSNSFNAYMKLIFCISLIGICITRLFIELFIQKDFSTAWRYVPYLYIGTVCTGLSSFLNTVYLAESKTKEIFYGTLLAGAVNIVTDVLMIKFIGIYAAAISTMIAGITLLIRRIHDNKKYYDFQVEWKQLMLMIIVNISATLIVAFSPNNFIPILMLFFSFIFTVFINKTTIQSVLHKRVKEKT